MATFIQLDAKGATILVTGIGLVAGLVAAPDVMVGAATGLLDFVMGLIQGVSG